MPSPIYLLGSFLRSSLASLGSYFGEIGCILGGIRRAGIKAETLCELQCLSKRNLNLLLGQHPEVGDDLRKVARSRMKEVKKDKKEKRKLSVLANAPKPEGLLSTAPLATVNEEPKNRRRKSIAEQNLDKLDQVDFGKLEDENEAFSDLRSDLKTLVTRKLSLTSGAVAGGSHLKPNEEAIRELNNTSAAKEKDTVDATSSDTATGKCSTHKSAAQIMASLSHSEQQVIRDFILQEVVYLLEKKLTSLADRLIASNERIMAKARDKWWGTLREHSAHQA